MRGLITTAAAALLIAAGLTGCGITDPPSWNQGRTAGPDGAGVPAAPPVADPGEELAAAQAARQSGDLAQAMAMFQEILAVNPSVTTAYVGLGDIHLEQDNFVAAERRFRQAVQLEPRNFDAQLGLGRALQGLNRLIEAAEAYRRALAIDAENYLANFNLGAIYLELDKAPIAVGFAEKAVQANPQDAQARINLGAAYMESGRYGDAVDELQTALELTEPTPELLMNLVESLGKEQRYAEAVNATEFLIRLQPSADGYERLGWGRFRIGDYQGSFEAYNEAVRLDGEHWQSYNGIGVNALNMWLRGGSTEPRWRQTAADAFRRSLRINGAQPKVVRLMSQYGL